MSRALPEWIGKTDDTPVPPRVQVRVFEAYGGRDYTTGQIIRAGDKWDVEHVIAIINGGQNRESNLAPILRENHPKKTRQDVKIKAKTARVKKKHLGLAKSKHNWPKRPVGYQPGNSKDIYGDIENG